MEVPRVELKRRTRKGRISLTQYLESQEDQDIIKLLASLELKRGEERVFLCLRMEEMMVYVVVVKKILIEGHLMSVDK